MPRKSATKQKQANTLLMEKLARAKETGKMLQKMRRLVVNQLSALQVEQLNLKYMIRTEKEKKAVSLRAPMEEQPSTSENPHLLDLSTLNLTAEEMQELEAPMEHEVPHMEVSSLMQSSLLDPSSAVMHVDMQDNMAEAHHLSEDLNLGLDLDTGGTHHLLSFTSGVIAHRQNDVDEEIEEDDEEPHFTNL